MKTFYSNPKLELLELAKKDKMTLEEFDKVVNIGMVDKIKLSAFFGVSVGYINGIILENYPVYFDLKDNQRYDYLFKILASREVDVQLKDTEQDTE